MIFFKRFELATTEIINQLWQNDYLDTPARNAAVELTSAPLTLKIWLERLLLTFAIIFLTAGILLFFAYNWAEISHMNKMIGILILIGLMAVLNFYLLHFGKIFVANLILLANAFLTGVFMAVYGQAYQTGADSYTLFLTWAIMILPWAIMARYLALWVMWILVCNIAMLTWWDLGIYPEFFESRHLPIFLAVFHMVMYVIMLIAVGKQQEWADKKWMKLLLSIGIFAPLSIYIMQAINQYRYTSLDGGFAISMILLVISYIFVRWIKKSLSEYSVAFFCAIAILLLAITKTVDEFTPGTEFEIFGFLINALAVIALFFYAYKYYREASQHFVVKKPLKTEAE